MSGPWILLAKVSAPNHLTNQPRLAQLCTEDARGPDFVKIFSHGKARISQLKTQGGDTILDDEP
jgi:hypothetical protein